MHTITSCLISPWLLPPCSSTTCSDIARQGLDRSLRDTHWFDAWRISGMGMTQKCSFHAGNLYHQSWRLVWWKWFLKSKYWESHASPPTSTESPPSTSSTESPPTTRLVRSSTTGSPQQLFERGREIINESGEKWDMGAGFGPRVGCPVLLWCDTPMSFWTSHTGKLRTFQSFGWPKGWNKLDQAVDMYPFLLGTLLHNDQ
jgi:hypothetical protein